MPAVYCSRRCELHRTCMSLPPLTQYSIPHPRESCVSWFPAQYPVQGQSRAWKAERGSSCVCLLPYSLLVMWYANLHLLFVHIFPCYNIFLGSPAEFTSIVSFFLRETTSFENRILHYRGGCSRSRGGETGASPPT